MSFETVKKVWMNGKLVDFADAKIHVFTHALHYGSGVFEGERCYDTARGPAIFRLDDHLDRLFWSAKIYRMVIPYTIDELREATLEVVRANGFPACYIRPLVYRGYGSLGVNPFPNPVDVAIGCYEWGKYLGRRRAREGRRRLLLVLDAHRAEHDARDGEGHRELREQPAHQDGGHHERLPRGDRDGPQRAHLRRIRREPLPRLEGPPLHAAPFGLDAPGITRLSVIQLARELDFQMEEKTIPREMIYAADEMFFTGTAAEITPIRSVDRIPVGNGTRGPMTEAIQKSFFDIVEGRSTTATAGSRRFTRASRPAARKSRARTGGTSRAYHGVGVNHASPLANALVAVLFVADPVPQPSSPIPGILSPQRRVVPSYCQFDFWLGDWTVTNSKGQFAGENHVTVIQGGCGIQENSTGADGGSGTTSTGTSTATGNGTRRGSIPGAGASTSRAVSWAGR